MPCIKVLPERLVNKIAAGEVVERPASIVKELVENALDAESTKIRIDIEKGGSQLISVSDDGIGMEREDAILSLKPHATSKISDDKDLFSIKTLGFRGEALPSMASVSRLTIITKPPSKEIGTKIIVEDGKVLDIHDIGAPSGTLIETRDLFYNTPARKKFLKSIRTEFAHIVDNISNMALASPHVQFSIYHNDRKIKNWVKVQNPVDRIIDVLGNEFQNKLFPVEFQSNSINIKGWLASPEISKKSYKNTSFVNGRYVRDKTINHALLEGYKGRLLKGQYPVAVLFIEIPFDQVDVNVHPAKHEIRFVKQNTVHYAVLQAVRKGLSPLDRLPWEPYPKKEKPEIERLDQKETNNNKKIQEKNQDPEIKTKPIKFHPSEINDRNNTPEINEKPEPGFNTSPITPSGIKQSTNEINFFEKTNEDFQPSDKSTSGKSSSGKSSSGKISDKISGTLKASSQTKLPDQTSDKELDQLYENSIEHLVDNLCSDSPPYSDAIEPFEEKGKILQNSHKKNLPFKYNELMPIGQIHNTYILCQSSNGLVLIDQHAAHERVVYEQIKESFLGKGSISIQGLLIPEIIELGFHEADIMLEIIPHLKKMGVEIEPFGGNSFAVKSVPVLLSKTSLKPLITEIIEKKLHTGFSSGIEDAFDECIILMACHSAIRSGQRLEHAEIKALIRQLHDCKHPSQCPHGRPTCVEWSLYDLKKNFKKIV